MANELIVTNAAALAALVDKTTGDTLTAAEYTSLKDALQEANTATRAANVIFSGPTTGAAAAPTFRALVAADIPSLSYQPVDATLTALAALGAGPGFLQVTGQDTFSIAALSGAQVNTALGYTAANAASLASSALTGALPALDGSALTALNASNLTTGTIPDARFPAVLPAISGANLTNLPGVSGVVSDAATNTVSDALVIQHETSGTAVAGFGTGLLFQGENAAGVMHDMASIDAVYSVATDGSENTGIDFRGLENGSEYRIAKLERSEGFTTLLSGYAMRLQAASEIIDLSAPVGIYTTIAGLGVWKMTSTASSPQSDNVYDIGTPALRVKDIHVMSVKTSGRSYLATPNSAPTDGDIANGAFSAYLDEAGNALKIRVRYSDGTLKLATIALA